MGIEYALYDRARKVYIELGKVCGPVSTHRFQMNPDRIAHFLVESTWFGEGPLEIHSDMGSQPHDEDGWLLVDDWSHKNDDDCICGLCDPDGEKRDDLKSRPWTNAEIKAWYDQQEERLKTHLEGLDDG